MRPLRIFIVLASLGAGNAALATTTTPAPARPATPLAAVAAPAPPVGPLPRGFSSYLQPTIPPSACRTVSAAEVQCQIPAMTAGRYLIEASGSSTSQGADALQALEIDIGTRQCGVGKDSAPWPSGARTFRLACEAVLMTDTPLVVRVLYADQKATKDPKGPVVSIRPLPWNGVLSAQPFAPKP